MEVLSGEEVVEQNMVEGDIKEEEEEEEEGEASGEPQEKIRRT